MYKFREEDMYSMDSVLSSTTNKTTLTIPSPEKKKETKNNLKSTRKISQYIL